MSSTYGLLKFSIYFKLAAGELAVVELSEPVQLLFTEDVLVDDEVFFGVCMGDEST